MVNDIWYELHNGQNDGPKLDAIDGTELPSDAKVVHLRHEIHKKNKNSLRDRDPIDLELYANEADMARRQQLGLNLTLIYEEEDKVEGPAYKVKGIDHPLLVVVPPPPPVLQLAAVQPAAATISTGKRAMMEKFFAQTIDQLELDESGHISVERMAWLAKELSSVYWRQCYSYILCTTIAFFTNVHEAYAEAAAENSGPEKNSMVLTGIQGTGKSVLGAIIALFLKSFGWKVTYKWGNSQPVTVGYNKEEGAKTIHIVDLSTGTAEISDVDDSNFVLVVSSANASRWHSLQQQQNWSETKGNYCFIDPASWNEIEAMANKRGGENLVEKAQETYTYVGGVPRLCLDRKSNGEATVKNAMKSMSTLEAVQNLRDLNDSKSASSTDMKKEYPGLICHTVPNNKFRNTFRISFASEYVAKQVVEKESSAGVNKLLELVNQLLRIAKARSLAGWIWESLLAKEFNGKSSSKITILGAELPCRLNSKSEVTELLSDIDASTIHSFDFKNFPELKTKTGKLVKNNKGDGFTAFAKAINDNFQALDAVLLTRRKHGKWTIAGLQITVAQTAHPVKERGMVDFVKVCREISKDKAMVPELWFLQPEAVLQNFKFVNLQPMVIDQTTEPPRKKTRAATNKRKSWNPDLQELKQYTGIVRIRTSQDANRRPNEHIAQKLKEAFSSGVNGNKGTSHADPKPSFRSWDLTKKAMEALEDKVDASLFRRIKSDLDEDEQTLKDGGLLSEERRHKSDLQLM